MTNTSMLTANPREDEGRAVPEGFTLPWNTTRTMADVWALSAAELKAARDNKKVTVVYRRYVARPAPENGAPNVR